MKMLNVYECSTYAEFIDSLRSYIDKSDSLSARQLSFRIGLKSSTPLCMALTGKRILSRTLARRIGEELKIQPLQLNYLELLIERESAKTRNRPVEKIEQNIRAMRVNSTSQKVLDDHSFISEWYHMVILDLINTPAFEEDADWIKSRLRRKVSTEQIKKAISKLLDLKLVQRDASGKLSVNTADVATSGGVPSEAAREHHRQMLARAGESLEEQAMTNREISSTTFQFDFERINEARREIEDFRDYIYTKYRSKNSNQIYQFNVQFFEHTSAEEA